MFELLFVAYPGAFSYRDLLNMDERDLKAWVLMAQRKQWRDANARVPEKDTGNKWKCKLEIGAIDKKLDAL